MAVAVTAAAHSTVIVSHAANHAATSAGVDAPIWVVAVIFAASFIPLLIIAYGLKDY